MEAVPPWTSAGEDDAMLTVACVSAGRLEAVADADDRRAGAEAEVAPNGGSVNIGQTNGEEEEEEDAEETGAGAISSAMYSSTSSPSIPSCTSLATVRL